MLALTAKVQVEDHEAALAAGLDGLLVKPLDRQRPGAALNAASSHVSDPLAA